MEKNHVAYKVVYDVKAQKMTEAYGILCYWAQDVGRFWLRSNCLNRFVGLGCSYNVCGDYGFHATEVQYDFSGSKRAGLFGMPLFCRWAGKYNLSNDTKATIRFQVGDTWWMQTKWECPITKNLKVTNNEHVDLKGLIYEPKRSNVKMGFVLEFKV